MKSIFLIDDCSDYTAWKAARLLEPSYFSLCNVAMLLQCSTVNIDHIYRDTLDLYSDLLTEEEFFRLCIFKIITKQRNKLSFKHHFIELLFKCFSELGYRNEISEICMKNYSEIIANINSLTRWEEFILLTRGPYPTADSEMYLNKIIYDVGEKFTHMKKLRNQMLQMIFSLNCQLVQ